MKKPIKQKPIREKRMTVVPKRSDLAAIEELNSSMKTWLTGVANLASLDLVPEVLGKLFLNVKAVTKVMTDDGGVESVLKKKIVTLLKQSGDSKGDKGGKEMEVAGLRLQMWPSRTGYDPKKVEARLRALGKDPQFVMVPTTIYSLPNPTNKKYRLMLEALGDAAEECKYDESWSVQTPKEI